MPYARIIGTGAYVPEKVLTNSDLSRMLGEDINEFVSQVLGISERHVCADNEGTVDLATHASRQALQSAGITPDRVESFLSGPCRWTFALDCAVSRSSSSCSRQWVTAFGSWGRPWSAR